MTVDLRRAAPPDVPWAELDARPDRTICQTRAWLDFLHETQGAQAVVAQVRHEGRTVGWFTGAAVTRRGVPILGSPLPGWTTGPMGFNLDDGAVGPDDLLPALQRFARHEGFAHLEVLDRRRLARRPLPGPFRSSPFRGFVLDLAPEPEAILAAMSPMARRNVRTGTRRGIAVREVPADELARFGRDAHALLRATLARKGTTPSFGPDRVDALLRHLHAADRVSALEARSPDGDLAAVGIFPGVPGALAGFWLGASDPRFHHLRPNEAVMWAAIERWRARGCSTFEFGGGGAYKAKYGGAPEELAWLRASRHCALEVARARIERRSRRGRQP